MDTAHAHPDDPQPLGASLRRSSGDRILLGLCAGIARSAGLSPLAVRLGAVLASAIVLPLVLLAYTVTAVLVPRDDGAALLGQGHRDRRDLWIALALTLLAAPAALSVGTDGGPAIFTGGFGFVVLPLIALGGLAFMAMRRDRALAASPATPATASAPYASGVEPMTAETEHVAMPGAAAQAATGATDPATAATQVHPGGTPPAEAPPTFIQPPAPTPPAPQRPGLTLPVLAAVAAVPAILAILLTTGAVDASAATWATALAIMAVISAGGAVAIAVLRPSYLSAAFLVLLAAMLGVSSIGVSQVGPVLDDGVGQRTYRATSPADLGTPYVLGAGQLDIDLRALRLQPRERITVQARLGFGELNIAVPRGTRIVTTRASSADELRTTARENGAPDSASAAAPTIVLDLRGRGVDAILRTGSGQRLTDLNVLARTEFGFWRGGRSDSPFTRTAGRLALP